ncbi:MAG TPA: hypothetical protein VHH73_20605, partial [Verrucomicrobiae bacterium]|nr:hypothetical protein [Verrucomicrobiae bacterium]
RLEREARKDEADRKEAKRKDRDWQESLQWMVQSLKAKGESKSPKPANPAPPVAPNPGESRSLPTATVPTANGGTSPNPVPSSPANPGQSNPIKPSPEPVATPSNESPAPNPLVQMGVPEVSIPSEIQPNPGQSRVLADSNLAPGQQK